MRKAKLNFYNMLRAITIIFVLVVVVGCVQTLEKFQTEMAAKDIKALTTTEIKSAFIGHTMLGKHPKYEWARYVAEDGTVKARTWGSWGEESAIGRWWINAEDMLCLNLDNDKYSYGDRCVIVYPKKDKNEYTHIIAIGQKPKSLPSGIRNYKLVPGDQSGVK